MYPTGLYTNSPVYVYQYCIEDSFYRYMCNIVLAHK